MLPQKNEQKLQMKQNASIYKGIKLEGKQVDKN